MQIFAFGNNNKETRHMNPLKLVLSVLILLLSGTVSFAQDRPNIVLILMDNFGCGEHIDVELIGVIG